MPRWSIIAVESFFIKFYVIASGGPTLGQFRPFYKFYPTEPDSASTNDESEENDVNGVNDA
jgi:hypothetical protein